MSETKQLIFVYDDMQKDAINHHYLMDVECITEDAWTFGYLYDTCQGYPILVEGNNKKVHGELYLITSDKLTEIERFIVSRSVNSINNTDDVCLKEQEIYTKDGIYQASVFIYGQTISNTMRYIPTGDWKTKTDSLDYCEVEFDAKKEQEQYKEYFEKEYDNLIAWRKFMLRFLIVTMTVFIMVSILSPWYRIFQLPSIDLLSNSKELKKDQKVQEWMKTVTIITANNRKATGFNVAATGTIITNYHVVDNVDSIFVTVENGQIFKGNVIQQYPELDLAIIDINGQNLPTANLSTILDVSEGEKVVIIGNPLGLSQVIIEGEVIGLIKIAELDVPVLALESPILQGSSGSPVFNSKGNVVAVIFANAGTIEKDNEEVIIGLAIPIDYLLEQDFFTSVSNNVSK